MSDSGLSEEALKNARAALEKVRLKRARLLTDRNAIRQGEKDKHYAWVNIHPDRIHSFTALGYIITKSPNVVTDYKQQDGTHRRADLILMECPQDLYDALKYQEEMDGIEGMESNAENMFLEFAEKYNIPVTTPEVSEP